ncbi:MAG: YqgE/AlgH family protein [Opitutaceae bacterium]|jgi:putative transcriptional regulator|nr:YqgE/AlgH family protein [Opitutaceae bacterium]
MRSRGKDVPSDKELTGSLLLAHPSLREPTFRKTVILLSSHSDDGAMGVVLNRPLGRTLGSLNTTFALGPLDDVPVYTGGPVQAEQVILCAWQVQAGEDGFRLYFGIDLEKAVELRGRDGMEIRAFLGYSGWSAGQLENELEHETWVVAPVGSDLLDYDADEQLWRGLLSALDPEWKILADEPDDPSAN